MLIILKYTGYTLLTFITLILLYIGCAWACSRITIKGEPVTSADITIYLRTNGVHTDLVLPVRSAQKDWSKEIFFGHTRGGDTTFSYVAFGWGDKGFYLETPTWADLKAKTAFRAAFGIGSSAMHTTFYHQLTENDRCIKTTISFSQYERLIAFIEQSFKKDSAGLPVVIPTEARYGPNDAFYEGTGRYSLFHTCNTWTNNGLKASGQKACWWTPFDKGIFYQYRQ